MTKSDRDLVVTEVQRLETVIARLDRKLDTIVRELSLIEAQLDAQGAARTRERREGKQVH